MALFFGLGIPYWAGMVVVAGLFLYEHSLLNKNDLSRLDMAFFNMNGYISMTVFLFTLCGFSAMKRFVFAISGASGSVVGIRVLRELVRTSEVYLIISSAVLFNDQGRDRH